MPKTTATAESDLFGVGWLGAMTNEKSGCVAPWNGGFRAAVPKTWQTRQKSPRTDEFRSFCAGAPVFWSTGFGPYRVQMTNGCEAPGKVTAWPTGINA